MDIEQSVARFETVMAGAWPTRFAQLQPGLDDEGIQRLGRAVAPYLVPLQVEALYRWRNGGDQGIFGGWRMERMFDLVATFLDVVCDAAEAGALAERNGRLGLDQGDYAESPDGPGWDPRRLARNPGSFQWPNPPPGTHLDRCATPDWPRAWLLPLGVTANSLAPRGATHTVTQLVSAATEGPVRGTIRGRVITGSGGAGWWNPVVNDGTGEIVVSCDTTLLPVAVVVGQEGEFDVLLDTADAPQAFIDEDPRVAALVNRFRPPLPTAHATGARPIPVPD